jgi:hypothetical protein
MRMRFSFRDHSVFPVIRHFGKVIALLAEQSPARLPMMSLLKGIRNIRKCALPRFPKAVKGRA